MAATKVAAREVRVRMYRGLLGDCFLLTILQAGGGKKHMLIDCGVLQNVKSGVEMRRTLPAAVVARMDQDLGAAALDAIPGGVAQITDVVKNLRKEVGKRIDVLVVTHEHYDHLSGFAIGKNDFTAPDLVVDQLWLAWTEDPEDSQARALRARFAKGKQAVALAAKLAERQVNAGAAADPRLRAVAGLAAFVGPVAVPGLPAAGGLTGAQTIEMLKTKARSVRYLEPGQVLGEVEALGLRAYVLGPPRDEKLLRKDQPSGGAGKEVYLTSLNDAAGVESAARASLLRLGADGSGQEAATFVADSEMDKVPFARPHRRPLGKPDAGETDAKSALRALYDRGADSWRQVDDEWTGAAEALALKMDSDTNNTSLVLAFELADKQVLLFPGDAQVGNWLSWGARTYPSTPKPGDPAPVTIDGLLRRVTFYKVGHHASHNATLRELGLKKMLDPRLTAAIPVVEGVARVQGKGSREPGKGWQMPYGDLYADLQERTKGRIVRGDGDPAAETKAFLDSPTSEKLPVVPAYDPGGLWVELTFTPRLRPRRRQREVRRPARLKTEPHRSFDP